MSSGYNKDLVRRTWQAFLEHDVEAALANMADDVVWLIPGRMELSGAKHGKDEIRRLRSHIPEIFTELHPEIRGIYEDGDTGVMELAAWGGCETARFTRTRAAWFTRLKRARFGVSGNTSTLRGRVRLMKS